MQRRTRSNSAEVTGADAVLSVVPYYNKPTQSGLYAHFRAIVQSTGLPIILYDVPSRTACGLADETVARLAELPRINRVCWLSASMILYLGRLVPTSDQVWDRLFRIML